MAKSSLRFNFPLRTIGTCTVAGFTGVGSGAGSLPISQNTFSYAIDGPLGDQGASYAFFHHWHVHVRPFGHRHGQLSP